jgi:hypothetical protein
MFVVHNDPVYEGMIIGIHSRDNDLVVNPIKGKQLTNVRSSGTDEAVRLVPPIQMSLEYAVEFIADDELVEITPKSIRLRKRYLKEHERKKAGREAGDIDVVILAAAHIRHVDPLERPHAALLAKDVVGDRVVSGIIGQVGRAGNQAEHLGLGVHRPQAHLGADRAIALAGAGADVDIGFEAHSAAVATAGVSFQHRLSFVWWMFYYKAL